MSVCESCGRMTRTIRGRCPNCGHLKDSRYAPPPAKLKGGGGWPDDFTAYLVGAVVVAILGASGYLAIQSFF